MGKTITSFEDLEVWKKSRSLTAKVYNLTSKDPLFRDFYLRDQLRKSAVSIMSNVAEGFERDGNREFLQALAIAKGSNGELLSQLIVAHDQGYLKQNEFQRLSVEIEHLGRMLGKLIRHLKTSPYRGKKFLTV